MTIGPNSVSYPYLALAKRLRRRYGDILTIADAFDRGALPEDMTDPLSIAVWITWVSEQERREGKAK